MEISYARLSDNSWGVRVHKRGGDARGLSGQTVTVMMRSGRARSEVLGPETMTANGNQTAWSRRASEESAPPVNATVRVAPVEDEADEVLQNDVRAALQRVEEAVAALRACLI